MSTEKHFISDPKDLVPHSLGGLVSSTTHLSLDPHHKVVYTKDLPKLRQQQVTLFCGGGSGHEPSHTGFVGPGILSAAVSGHVFASPTSSQVLACLQRTYSEPHGTLVVIKNYTGDVLNFGRAVEQFKAQRADKPTKVEMVVVQDDVGVVNPSDDDEGGVGRRGLAGTVLVYKVAGATAQMGGSLEEAKRMAELVNSRTFTLGCTLNAASVPGQGLPRWLASDEIEVGMGIHNEPGFETQKLRRADELVPDLVDHILSSAPFKKLGGGAQCRAVLMVNNLGATSNLELGLVTKLAREAVIARGLKVERMFSGTYMTGLAMPGISLSVLVLPEEEAEQKKLLELIDHPAYCPGWHNQVQVEDTAEDAEEAITQPQGQPLASNEVWERAIQQAYESVVAEEPQVTLLDQLMGDGDCGQGLLAGATAIYQASQRTQLPLDDPASAISSISTLVEDSMGGTSGIIYCLFLYGLAQQLTVQGAKTNDDLNPRMFGQAMVAALEQTLYKYTSARPGHRTLIDALQPFAEELAETGDLDLAMEAANEGAEATADMKPKRGRAVYVQQKQSVPDAGAVGLVSVLKGIVNGLNKKE